MRSAAGRSSPLDAVNVVAAAVVAASLASTAWPVQKRKHDRGIGRFRLLAPLLAVIAALAVLLLIVRIVHG